MTVPCKGSSGVSAGVAATGAGPVRQGGTCVLAASRCGLSSVTQRAGIRLASLVLLLRVSAVGGSREELHSLLLAFLWGLGKGIGGLVSVAVSSTGLLC